MAKHTKFSFLADVNVEKGIIGDDSDLFLYMR
jgi:hypothetical protein